MEKFKGLGCTVIIDGENIILNAILQEERKFTFKDILALSFEPATSMQKGYISISIESFDFKIQFKNANFAEYKRLYDILKNGFNTSSSGNSDIESNIGKTEGLHYYGGHPLYPKEDPTCGIAVTNRKLDLFIYDTVCSIPFESIKDIRVENGGMEDDIKIKPSFSLTTRYTIDKKKEKILAIDFVDEMNIQSTILMGGIRSTIAHSLIYKGLIEFRRRNPQTVNQVNDKGISNLDEIEKLKKLLDIGAITQEEFDAKKKYLLNL